jgi:Uma2 family endonuclease
MEANRTRQRWTYEEYAQLPQPSEARGTRFEVIDGELYVTPGPSRRHQRIVTRLSGLLDRFVEENGLGEVLVSPFDVLFAEGDCVEPDIVFVRSDREDILTERGAEGPPDLLVEVLSPSTAGRDRGIKLDRYRLFGVAEYWVIDPDEPTVQVWRLGDGAIEPLALGPADTLRWQPLAGGPLREISVAELLRTR